VSAATGEIDARKAFSYFSYERRRLGPTAIALGRFDEKLPLSNERVESCYHVEQLLFDRALPQPIE
jgi:hypothetical protein